MEKIGGIWSPIIFCQDLFEGADAQSWQDLELHNFPPVFFLGSWLMQKVGGILSPIIFCQILLMGAG